MRRRLLLITATVLLVTACVPASRPPGPTASSTVAPTASITPSPTPRHRVPIALAVHHSRDSIDVPADVARRIIAGEPTQWADLGAGGNDVRIVEGTGDEALQAVIGDVDAIAVLPATAVDERVRVLRVDGVHPLRNPENYPVTTDAPGEPDTVTTITVVGDIMLGRRVGQRYRGDLDRVFEPFAERLSSADITVGNMESTLSTNGDPTQGGDSFAADPGAVVALDAAGFDALTLANNHLGDYGARAMLETFEVIDAANVGRFGAGVNLEEASRAWITEVRGTRIAFIGTESIGETPAATGDSPGTNRLNMPPRTPPLDEDALNRVTRQIGEASRAADVVIVMPHWGTQYVYEPEPIQREVARRFADAGADLVLGGHPHQVQGWEAINDTTVVYSLPNFVFDMTFSRQVQEGMFVEIVLWGDRVVAVEPVPYRIVDYIPQPTSADDGRRILSEMRSTGTGPYAEPG